MTVTDAMVEAAAKATYEGLSRQGYELAGRDIQDLYRAEAKAALEAASKAAPQPMVERGTPLVEALKAWRASDGAWWIPPGAVAEVAECLTDEIRTAVVAGLTEHRSPAGGRIPQIYVEQITDTVLALLNGTAK